MNLELQVRRVYGKQTIYPMNDTALKLTNLLKKRTFSTSDVHELLDLGFTVEWIPEQVQL